MFIAASSFRIEKGMGVYPDSDRMATPFPYRELHAPEFFLPFEHTWSPSLQFDRPASYKFK